MYTDGRGVSTFFSALHLTFLRATNNAHNYNPITQFPPDFSIMLHSTKHPVCLSPANCRHQPACCPAYLSLSLPSVSSSLPDPLQAHSASVQTGPLCPSAMACWPPRDLSARQ